MSLIIYIFHIIDKGDTDRYYDRRFAKRIDLISNTRKVTERFHRISSNKSRYCISNIDQSEHIQDDSTQDKDNDTYLDSLYNHLIEQKIDEDMVEKLRQYFVNQEFDTDPMDIDLQTNDEKLSNIVGFMNHKSCMDAIFARLNQSRRM